MTQLKMPPGKPGRFMAQVFFLLMELGSGRKEWTDR